METKLPFSITCHPQNNGQKEVDNQTITTILRGIVSKSLRYWNTKFSHTELTYNGTPNYATSRSHLRYDMALPSHSS